MSDPLHSLVVLWRQNPIFAAMDDQTLTRLAEQYPARVVAPRELVIEVGVPAEHLHVLLSGTVRVFHRAPDGREAVVKLLRAPSVFADMELLNALSMLECVDAIDEVRLALIPGDEYRELLHRFPAAMYAHLQHIAAAFCVAARNERQVFARLEQRIANLLLSFGDDEPASDDESVELPVELPVQLSQEDIARSLGTVRRSVARIIGDWQRSGWVEQKETSWVLHRPAELEELAAPIRHSLNYQMGMSLSPLEQREGLARASLEVASPHSRWAGRTFAVEEELIVGRQPPARLLLPSETLSPQHCRIHRAATGGRFWIEDLDSLNGTEVNDRAVRRSVLKDGDRIRVGGFVLLFRLQGSA